MPVNDKIEQAERWLDKIQSKKFGSKEAPDIIGAFFYSIDSIPDHLLEDVSKEFDLQIPIDSKNIRTDFYRIAKKECNDNALFFNIWFKSQLYGMQQRNQIGKFIHSTRNSDTHRILQKPKKVILDFGEVTLDIPNHKNNKKPTKIVTEKKIEKILFYYEGLPKVDIEQACVYYFKLMKNFVINSYIFINKIKNG